MTKSIFLLIIFILSNSFYQKTEYNIVFSNDKKTAKIISNKMIAFELNEFETIDLKEMLEAVEMKVYKNKKDMLIDFIPFLNFRKDNRQYFGSGNAIIEIPKLSKEIIRILQVKSVVEINRFRKTQNLPNLLYNKVLQEVAQDYADYCTKNNWRSSHTSKEGITWYDRIESKMPNYSGTENLYFGFGSPKESIDLLITSPGHLSNLKTNKLYVAVGVSQFTDGSLVYVQNFAGKKPF